MASRTRFLGSPADLRDVVQPFVTSARWLVYDEAEEVAKTKTLPDMIVKHATLLGRLRELQTNMAFSKTLVQKTFELVLSESQFELEDKAGWVAVMTKRLRNLCRATAQATDRGRPPAWAKALPWVDGDGEPTTKRRRKNVKSEAAKQAPEENEAQDEQAFFYGFDFEVTKCWRRKATGGAKELCTRLREPNEARLTDGMLAEFRDGSVHEVPEYTVQDWRSRSEVRQGTAAASSSTLWMGEHTLSHNKLAVVVKPDRGELVTILEQGCQICQIRTLVFGGEGGDFKQKATDFMMQLAERYSKAEFEKANIYHERDAELKRIGINSAKVTKKSKAAVEKKDMGVGVVCLRATALAAEPKRGLGCKRGRLQRTSS